ncbi:hypothetical protein ACPB9J_06120 [Streptomyces lavendulocolor]|uniref:hypothetical protein n=1 Tax=Streptomyces lavendulocolor TaxID=67316 RepID=UPI003C2B6D29
MNTKHCAVDGWVDAIPTPGPRGTATFDLIVRPADIDILADDVPDTVVTCTSGDPQITHELLNGIQPGDLLRVTGTLVQLPTPGEPARIIVDALEVMDTALVPVLRDMVIDRYGDYCVVFDADRDQVSVFTSLGQWVGLADNADAAASSWSSRSAPPTPLPSLHRDPGGGQLMNPQTHLAIDGYVDALPAPGTSRGPSAST